MQIQSLLTNIELKYNNTVGRINKNNTVTICLDKDDYEKSVGKNRLSKIPGLAIPATVDVQDYEDKVMLTISDFEPTVSTAVDLFIIVVDRFNDVTFREEV